MNTAVGGGGFTSSPTISSATPFPVPPTIVGPLTASPISGGIEVAFDLNNGLSSIQQINVFAVPASLANTPGCSPTAINFPKNCSGAPPVYHPSFYSESHPILQIKTSLTYNTEYLITVQALNAVGSSSWTPYPQSSVKFASGPTGGTLQLQNVGVDHPYLQVKIVAQGGAQFDLHGVKKSQLTLKIDLGNGNINVCPNAWTETEPLCSISKVVANTAYPVTVTASDGVGFDLVFSTTTDWTVRGSIASPVINSVTTGLGSSMSVNFKKAVLPDSIKSASYQVFAQTGNADDPRLQGDVCSPNLSDASINCSVSGAVPGIQYTVWIEVTIDGEPSSSDNETSDGLCNDQRSLHARCTFVMGTPTPASNVVASTVGDRLQISWTPGLVNGFPITGSSVEATANGVKKATCVTKTAIPSCLFNSGFLGVNPNIQITELATLVDPSTGKSLPQASVSNFPAVQWSPPPGQPSQPMNLTADAIQDGANFNANGLVVWWNPPLQNSNSVSYYQVTATATSDPTKVERCTPTTPPSDGHLYCHLFLPIGFYKVSVSVVDVLGRVTTSSSILASSSPDTPWVPTELTGFADTAGGTTFTFKSQATLQFLSDAFGKTVESNWKFQCTFSSSAPAAGGVLVGNRTYKCFSKNNNDSVVVQASNVKSGATSTSSQNPKLSVQATTPQPANIGSEATIEGAATTVSAAAWSADGKRIYSLDPKSSLLEVAAKSGNTWTAQLLTGLPGSIDLRTAKSILVTSQADALTEQIFVTFAGSKSIAEITVSKANPTTVTSSITFNAPSPVSAITSSYDRHSLEICDGTSVDRVNIDTLVNGASAQVLDSVQLAQACASVITNSEGTIFALAGGAIYRVNSNGTVTGIRIEPLSGNAAQLLWAGQNNLVLGDSLGNLVVLTLPSSNQASVSKPQFLQLGAAGIVLKGLSSPKGYFAVSKTAVVYGSPKGTAETVSGFSNLS